MMLVLALIVGLMKFKRDIPLLLEDIAVSAGEQINEGIKETFANPNVKKAFTVLGKQSGVSRASEALRNKVAEKAMEGIPSLNLVLEQFDITPLEGMQLLRDPIVGPFIQGIIKKGLGGILAGGGSTTSNDGRKGFGL